MLFIAKRQIRILTCFLTLFWVGGCGGGSSKVLEKNPSSELKGVHYKETDGGYLLRDECLEDDASAVSSQCKFEVCSLVADTTEVLEGSCTAAFLDSQGKAVWVKDRDLRAWLQHKWKHTYSLYIEPMFSVKGFAEFGALFSVGSVLAGVVFAMTRSIVGAAGAMAGAAGTLFVSVIGGKHLIIKLDQKHRWGFKGEENPRMVESYNNTVSFLSAVSDEEIQDSSELSSSGYLSTAVSFLGRDLKEYGGKSGALIHEYCLPVVDDESGEIAVECEEL